MKNKIIDNLWKVFVAIALFSYSYFAGTDLVLSVLIASTLIGMAELVFAILVLIFYGSKYILTRLK